LPVTRTIQDVSIGALSDGHFVVAWTEYFYPFVNGHLGIWYLGLAQVLNGDGSKSGSEIAFTPLQQQDKPILESAIAPLADNRFIATWSDDSQPSDGSGTATHAIIYNRDGSISVPEFLVNTGSQNSIATLSDGRFVVGWADYSQRPTIRQEPPSAPRFLTRARGPPFPSFPPVSELPTA
jgi:hypothetical protein